MGRTLTRLKIDHALSYADAFAAVPAQSLNATLLTGDPELLELDSFLKLARLERD